MFRICILLLVTSIPAIAQVDFIGQAMGRMEKKAKWPKVEQNLRKSLSKDPINPEALYLLALYFFNTKNPSCNNDSAFHYSLSAKSSFQRVTSKDRERLKRNNIDSMVFQRLTLKIDSASYETAKNLNTEQAYQHFIDVHAQAAQMSSAIELRDEVAFLNALKINSYSAFEEYVARYPYSNRNKEAQSRYERLLFEAKTKDEKLSSYIKFLNQFPSTPYRPQAERSILELSTLSGSQESFYWFIENYSGGASARQARNILYKLQFSEKENTLGEETPATLTGRAGQRETDSLTSLEKLNELYWIPVIKSGKYGFMDENGAEVISPAFEWIDDDYRCGEIRDRLLVTSGGLISKNGSFIWHGNVKEAKEIGLGFWLVSSDSSNYVIHESGFQIGSKANSAKAVGGRFIALENKSKWSLYSLTGKQLVPPSYDDISSIDSLIIMIKSEKKILVTPSQLALTSNPSLGDGRRVFDDIKRWGSQQYWVRNGLLEGVVDARLNFLIPLDRQELRKASFGFIRGKDEKISIKGIPRFENVIYKSVIEQGGWLRLQTNEGHFQLYDKILERLSDGDSVWFKGQVAFVALNDSIDAFLPSGQKISFYVHAPFQFKEFGDSSSWLILDEKKRKVVYDAASGIKLFTMEVDQLEPVSPDIFLLTRAGKKGLVSETGKIIVPNEFEAIVQTEPTGYSLLKGKKFGWFDSKLKSIIKPAYDRNIRSYNSSLKIAFKDKGYGFIYNDGRPKSVFEWEEILYWNDSTALVKKGFQWMWVDIHSERVLLDRVRNYTVVKDSPLERIFIVRQDNAFGVISSRHGIIIPIQYSDVINLGSKDVPLYFTERHIKEAGISVVVYFDQNGKIIRKQAMESDEFDKIVCDN